MANIKLMKWNPLEHLKSNKAMIAYLAAALEENDPALVRAAIRDIAKAHGMSILATKIGIGEKSFHKALSPRGRLEFSTALKIMNALGIALKPIAAKSKPKIKKNLKSHKAA